MFASITLDPLVNGQASYFLWYHLLEPWLFIGYLCPTFCSTQGNLYTVSIHFWLSFTAILCKDQDCLILKKDFPFYVILIFLLHCMKNQLRTINYMWCYGESPMCFQSHFFNFSLKV